MKLSDLSDYEFAQYCEDLNFLIDEDNNKELWFIAT
jgi:hypothetical protein